MTPSVVPSAVSAATALLDRRYVVGASFASGGMGTIHLARIRGAGGFARTVAVKRLFPGYASDVAFRQMLLDEARLASRIRHPNVVPTLDVWEEQNDLYVVMEYVHGVSLARLLELSNASPMPVSIALGIFEGILSGLHAAHEARSEDGTPLGMVHRDVSPQNILVGADGVARLIDFGIAKAATGVQVTEPGVIKGKTSYMAPEQLLGQRVSRLADIFAASAVLWEVLANHTLLDEHGEDTLELRLNASEQVRPSRYRDGIAPALDAIVLRGLALPAGQRFPTAEAMAYALRGVETPAAAVEIARWVRDTASDELEIAEERVHLFERAPDSSSSLPSLPESNETGSGVTSARTRNGGEDYAEASELASSRAGEWRLRAILGAAALAAMGITGFSYWDHARGAGAAGASTQQRAPTTPASALAESPSPPIQQTASAPPQDIAPPSREVARAPSPVSVRAQAASQPLPMAPSAPHVRAQKRSCDPPYTMDANGRKTYDPRCF